ncbi:Flp family type IVb pilin [Devosia sp. XJ19-1]|uniref:Flp family type IVb pilin n=1 Tax=Devosia ureilytica TaxID=2952754 RepID=A0A9Q4AS89_9HYPH|nr:Flp family type IVb pilin [Devosia ureilytica]MCP8885389.1 Flp family type IVb pilin [Devosia ureilytica]MCP8888935.1 Flp family type IVb pilin [Devosia ureilytica]
MLAQIIRRFAADQTGATAIEYALLGTIIAVALVASFTLVGDGVANMFGSGSTGAVGAIGNSVNKL